MTFRHSILLAILSFGLFCSIPASAQNIAPQPCDSEYWKQLTAKAWLEAEREIMQNQNLIFKPDSVFQYTCFDRFLNINAWEGGDIFVHTAYFGDPIIPRATQYAMEQALSNVVYQSLVTYLSGNYEHTFLGGRTGPNMLGSESIEHTPQSPTGKISGGYVCQHMSKVWKASKCANFIDNEAFEKTDGFYPFTSIAGHGGGSNVAGYADGAITNGEARQFPDNLKCSGLGNSGAYAALLGKGWKEHAEAAANRKDDGKEYYTAMQFQTPLKKVFEDVEKRLTPDSCHTTPIYTGVTIIVDERESHKDGVCTNPGCIYQKYGSNGRCVQAGFVEPGP